LQEAERLLTCEEGRDHRQHSADRRAQIRWNNTTQS
jgi:hypothetical protein